MDNAFRALQRFGRCARCSSPVVSSQQSQTCGSKLGDIRPLAKRMEYQSIADPNRCLLPADLLTPARRGRVAQIDSGVTREISSHGFLPPIHCKSVPGIISSYPCLWSLRQLHLVETAISSARLTFEVFSGFDS